MSTEIFKHNSIENQEETQKNKYLTFSIDKEDYGIEIYYINDIIGIQTIAEMPSVPTYIKGITNLRGSIIPVVDVRVRFKKPELDYDDRTCIVVVEYEELIIGLIVDSVREVIKINEENLLPPPNARMGYYNRYVKNIGKVGDNVKLILDLEKLLKEDHELQ